MSTPENRDLQYSTPLGYHGISSSAEASLMIRKIYITFVSNKNIDMKPNMRLKAHQILEAKTNMELGNKTFKEEPGEASADLFFTSSCPY